MEQIFCNNFFSVFHLEIIFCVCPYVLVKFHANLTAKIFPNLSKMQEAIFSWNIFNYFRCIRFKNKMVIVYLKNFHYLKIINLKKILNHIKFLKSLNYIFLNVQFQILGWLLVLNSIFITSHMHDFLNILNKILINYCLCTQLK